MSFDEIVRGVSVIPIESATLLSARLIWKLNLMEDGGPTWRHYLLEPCTSEVELELGSSLADKQTRRGAGSMYLERTVVHPSYCLSPLVLFASPETDERPLERLTD